MRLWCYLLYTFSSGQTGRNRQRLSLTLLSGSLGATEPLTETEKYKRNFASRRLSPCVHDDFCYRVTVHVVTPFTIVSRTAFVRLLQYDPYDFVKKKMTIKKRLRLAYRWDVNFNEN